ncbi:hypothetical protein IWX62_001547 [Arthrobacter sp. CAN_A1]
MNLPIRLGTASGVAAPDPSWADYFMIRALDGASIA